MSRLSRFGIIATVALVGLAIGAPPTLAAPSPASPKLTADLDGRPIPISEVGDWYCEDFDFPQIHCFSDPGDLELVVSLTLGTASTDLVASSTDLAASSVGLAASSSDYVIVYDQAYYGGSYMYVSQDYSVLALIGWNDRISSFRTLNGQSGHFFADWFYGGSVYYFCCGAAPTYLGGWDDTFSSVHRG